jgi:general secretion pathway protein J
MEVMVAVGITALMGAAIAGAFQSTFTAKDTIEADADHYRQIRVAMNRMAREIGAAFVSDRYDNKRYRDRNDRPTNFIGERDQLTFSAFAHQRLYSETKETDQVVIEYVVKPSQEERGRQDLVRRANPLLEGPLDRGGSEDVLFEGIKRVEFAYWDSEREEWEDAWDTRRNEFGDKLPTRVRITLVAVDETGKERRYSTQTRVMLNSRLERF